MYCEALFTHGYFNESLQLANILSVNLINNQPNLLISIGANDFLNNYLLPVLSIGARISESPDAFVDDLINHFRDQLTVRKLKHL